MTPKALVKSIPDDLLRCAVREVLEWERTGVLPGETTRHIANRLVSETGLSEDGTLRDTDTLIMREAAMRFAGNG